ncbi:hypothetical protein BKA70DRAFT_542913 [Coprinopsis sp. MPI-PUGE-AT-0042]|nr:hypothetical protein BKA70DRAFT_542913 [Coprinopsis sp. MPI-PUGE-AT-0042]
MLASLEQILLARRIRDVFSRPTTLHSTAPAVAEYEYAHFFSSPVPHLITNKHSYSIIVEPEASINTIRYLVVSSSSASSGRQSGSCNLPKLFASSHLSLAILVISNYRLCCSSTWPKSRGTAVGTLASPVRHYWINAAAWRRIVWVGPPSLLLSSSSLSRGIVGLRELLVSVTGNRRSYWGAAAPFHKRWRALFETTTTESGN